MTTESSYPTGDSPLADIPLVTGGSAPGPTPSSGAAPHFTAKPTSQTDELVDQQLVNQTKHQIRSLVQEIAELSKTECSVEDFYQGFLTRTVSALASVGGAVWTRPELGAPLQLDYQINLKQTQLASDTTAQRKHTLLLNKLLESEEPTLVAPLSGTDGEDDAGNPTEYLLVVGPLKIDNETVGLVEIFQRAGAGPTTQRGYLRFLTQMCDIASDYLRNQRLRSFHDQQQMWQRLEQFMRTVHQGLDTEQTLYTIANEGRRLIDCDRVSVATTLGRRTKVQAVSGLDSIERRAEQIKKLGDLATRVVRSGQPLWYAGDDRDLPPQIESRLHDYIDRSHSKMLAIVPLLAPAPVEDSSTAMDNAERQKRPAVLGALIVEQLADSNLTSALEKRINVVAEHSCTALANTTEHNRIFLMPLWKAIGKGLSPFRTGNRIKTITVASLLTAAVLALCLIPYPFSLGSKGSLIPATQHDVFANVDGILEEITLAGTSDEIVEKDQVLAQMTNNDLLIEIQNLEGERNRTREQIFTLQQAAIEDQPDHLDSVMLHGETTKARAMYESIERKLALKMMEHESLTVRSPARGQVVNWQVRQKLLRRPVTKGQKLMTIVDPLTEWQVELELPERRVTHLLEAKSKSDGPVSVTFALVSYPGTEFQGRLISIDRQLDVHSDEGNTMLVRIAFENEQVPSELLRSGTRVTAQLHCGERSVGYVIFHELIETVQSSMMLWF